MDNKNQNIQKITITWKVILIMLPFITAIVALCIGRIAISPIEVLQSLIAKFTDVPELSPINEITLWNLRLPRILLALLVGAGLSVAGCAFQSLFSNPLATPDTVGVASGASFGAALALLFGFYIVAVQIISFVFGIIAVALTLISASGRKKSKLHSIILAGIMIGSLFSALISLIKFVADTESQLPAISYWLMGSLDAASFSTLLLGAPQIIIGIIILILLRWRMNLLSLSEEEAISSGTNIKLLRAVTIISATMITASCVSMCGMVGWVGLLVPHMCRMKFGNNLSNVLPASVLFGSAFMCIVDTIARSISASSIPISILTAIIGAPFFIFLMRRNNSFS